MLLIAGMVLFIAGLTCISKSPATGKICYTWNFVSDGFTSPALNSYSTSNSELADLYDNSYATFKRNQRK